MSVIRRLLLASAAAALPCALHAADDNAAHVDQLGSDNRGLIEQTGIANLAGTASDPILQDGFFNALSILQSGAGNRAGAEGGGIDQVGRSATPSVFNVIGIEQRSNGNVVGEIYQGALGALPEGANRLSITQQAGDGNRVTTVIQEQSDGMPGQQATVVQSGEGNVLALVEQRSLSPAQFSENRLRARFTGAHNGGVGLTGPALASGAPSSSLVQTVGYDGLGANGNVMDLEVTGDFNRFGIFQGGRLNSTGLITVSGNGNEIGLRQDGLENDVTASVVAGDGNRIGLDQIGTNRVFLDLIGASDDNDVLGVQEGTNDLSFRVEGAGNVLTAEQGYDRGMGGANDGRIIVAGSGNVADLAQFGSNRAVLAFAGDGNNVGAMSGAAASAGLGAGSFRQQGAGNALDVAAAGDANLAAALQQGDGNAALVTITGASNQAAVTQTGNLNNAWLRQTGTDNRAALIQ